MNKIKLLTYSVIGLLFLNIGIICFLFFSRPMNEKDGFNRKPREIISEKLHFDSNQIKQYEQLIEVHKEKMESLNSNYIKLKYDLYLLLTEKSTNIKLKDSIINQLAMNQKEIENTYFEHFLDIKKLCKKNQLNDFNELTNELGKLFSKQSKQISTDHHPQRPPRDIDSPFPPRDSPHHRPPPRYSDDENRPGPPSDDE